MNPEPPPAPSRARRIRLTVLLVCLGLAIAAWGAKRLGYFAFLEPPGFEGELRLGTEFGVVVEQVDLLSPPARLVVARVPRGKGYRLRAALLDDARPELRPLSVVAETEALVAVNGDYHRLDGLCFASPFSTLIDDGRPRALGSPFGYAAQFWLDADGAPRIERLDLGARVVRSDGAALDVHYNQELGDALLIDRHTPVWSSSPLSGRALEPTGPFRYTVRGAVTQRFEGPALLARPGTPAAAYVDALEDGEALRLETTGEHAGRAILAIGTGPHLISGGRVRSELSENTSSGWVLRHPRTAVGFDDEHIYLVTTLQAPRCGLTMVEIAEVMQALGCQEALNLDGGPSTSLWVRTGWQGGRVVNLPAGQEGETPVATGLLVLPPEAGKPGLR